MADNRSKASRSALMARIGGRDTAPELTVRRLLHGMGYRFRLHRKGLPGTPDIVLPGRWKAIFVHGCFWHAHTCRLGKAPKSSSDYWGAKRQANSLRDARKARALRRLGWSVLTVWQCQLKDEAALSMRLRRFLGLPGKIPIDKSR